MWLEGRASTLFHVMYARAVEEAATDLRNLRHEEWEDFGLATAALALAFVAANAYHPLVLPLLLGGLFVGALGLRALWRRWDILDRLSGEPDAYAIPEVLHYAARDGTWERRSDYALLIRHTLRDRAPYDARIGQVADELEALERELTDHKLELDLAHAVTCRRLLTEVAESPLFDSTVPAEDLRSTIRQIRSGFAPRRLVHRDQAHIVKPRLG